MASHVIVGGVAGASPIRNYHMRDYTNIDKYLDELAKSVYPQPADPGHTEWAEDAIDKLMPKDVKVVLDVGCGEGFCEPIFKSRGVVIYTGITLGQEDYDKAISLERHVVQDDMTFLPNGLEIMHYHLIFARHALEHSPMPLLTLMDWYRVSRKYLIVILPAPEYWGKGGRNHYYVLDKEDWEILFFASGWQIVKYDEMTTTDEIFLKHNLATKTKQVVEYRWLLQK